MAINQTTAPRPVSDVLRQSVPSMNGQRAAELPTDPAGIQRAHIVVLWQRMAAIYGHKWVSSYGADDSDDTWLMGLGGITPQEVATGLSACITRADAWPPTLPEFRAMCRPPKKRRENEAMYRDHQVALPAPHDPTVTAKHLAAIRAAIGASRAAASPAAEFVSDPGRRKALADEIDREREHIRETRGMAE